MITESTQESQSLSTLLLTVNFWTFIILDGLIFYLKGNDLKEVRFPKLEDFQKRYKWKKMNFVTHLPKKDPKVFNQFFLSSFR